MHLTVYSTGFPISKCMLLQPTEIVYEDTKSFQYNAKILEFFSLMEVECTHCFFLIFRENKFGTGFKLA